MISTVARTPSRTISSVLDHAAVIAAFLLASGVSSLLSRIGLFVWPDVPSSLIAGWPRPYIAFLVTSLLLWTATSTYSGIYRSSGRDAGIYRRLWRCSALWAALLVAGVFLLKLGIVSRQFGITFVGSTIAFVTFREFCEQTVLGNRRKAPHRADVIVIGASEERHQVAGWLRGSRMFRFDRIRELDPAALEVANMGCAWRPSSPSMPISGSPVTQHAFIVAAGLSGQTLRKVVLGLLRNRWCVHVVPTLMDTRLFRYTIDEFAGTLAIHLEPGQLLPIEVVIKRALDVVGASFLLLAFSPILAATALLVKLSSPGPILFNQTRIGQDGKPFRMHKFRSMRTDAEELLKQNRSLYAKYVANNFKLAPEDDFRVTRIGRFLRSSSLDELPQFWNVLMGEMSLVGPRPVVPNEVARYGEFASLLLSVKPGITGHWQTSGRSEISEYSKRVLLDMEYIRDQSLGVDLGILIRTAGTVLRREGSY